MVHYALTVWCYDSPMGAVAGEVRLKDLQQQGGITVLDAITLTWVAGTHEPRIGHLRRQTSAAAARGSALGALVGAVVLAPIAGAAVGAGVGAAVQRLRGTGIDERFLDEVRAQLSPGTSALLVLSRDANLELVRPFILRGLVRGDVTLLRADLDDDAPEALVAFLAEVQRRSIPRPGRPQE